MADKYDLLKLENQLCFPLYACSKEIVRRYKTYLDKLDLTYTQYIVMMVMWEEKELNVKELGDKLFLDSGTLTPVLKNLEAKGYVTRERSKIDERTLIVTLTDSGKELREMAVDIPVGMRGCLKLSDEEMIQLRTMLGKILSDMGDVE